ncbi:MAG: type II toxin-antitoxin system VapC family toxin, partial [Gammaproteobacteria bacterium]
ASAIAALLFGEPEAPTVAAQLRNGKLVAPPLLAYEVASVCLKKLRRYPERRDALLAAHQLLGRMPIVETSVDLSEAVALAEHVGLTVYDASYIWLALKLRSELITLDQQLAERASRMI